MMETGIYIELSTNVLQEKERRWGYVLEAPGGRTVCKSGTCKNTMHGATLEVLNNALGRYRKASRITIHAADEWVLHMIEHQLTTWEQLAKLVKIHTITIAPGRHAYSAWLQSEMEKMERGK